MKQSNMTKVVCVSDGVGRLVRCGTFAEVNLANFMHVQGEDCECEEGECDCSYFGEYMVCLFKIDRKVYSENMKSQSCHPSHWLSELGEELDLGDFV